MEKEELHQKTDLEKESEALLREIESSKDELEKYYARLTDSDEEMDADVESKIASIKRANKNLLKAQGQAALMQDELSARWKDISKGKKRKVIPAPPANAVIDLAEERQNHFAQKLNIYKLLLICFIGSFLGVVIEMLWCLLTQGFIESRAGLVYGPFNLLYGVGAVTLTVALYGARNKGRWLSFIGGMIVGSAVEYGCSWVQEIMFGSRSWDYSHMPFNLNGRICLLYSVFWGILGVLWVKNLYPRFTALILKIPERVGKVLTWLLTAFFVFNVAMSVIAVYRWALRMDGVAATNVFWQFIDTRFHDERMWRIFCNMRF